MATRKRKTAGRQATKRKASRKQRAPAVSDLGESCSDNGIQTSGLSLHELFQQQAMAMLERADLSEEQKQSILVAMNCPCCGAGGLSYTVKLKRKT